MQRVFKRAVFVGLAAMLLMMSAAAFGQVRITVGFAPPPLPVYEQPVCPGDGYIWTPGYWDWSDDDGDYYWVPGTWVLAPEVGYLWTPPYWGWEGDVFLFHAGYWGPHVGFYGGIDYGFGYFGDGYAGGRWDNGHFFYNREVTNVNVTVIKNVYNQRVENRTVVNHVSYNGGNGGIMARPNAQQEEAARERHVPPPAPQEQHVREARGNPELRADANHGKPPIAATDRPGDFKGNNAKPAREAGGAYNPPPNHGKGAQNNRPVSTEARPLNEIRPENNAGNGKEGKPSGNIVHPKDIPPAERAAAPNTGNEKLDKKYQAQQEKMQKKQDQDSAKLQARQEKEDQKLAQKNADDARKQQQEQKHAQQTQQMQQRHTQQQQKLQQRQAPPAAHSAPAPKPAPAGKPKG